MPEEEVEQREENGPDGDRNDAASPPSKRALLTRRNIGVAAGIAAVAAIILLLLSVFLFRTGYADRYVKAQLTEKMAEIGVDFGSDVFRLSLSPLELELKNAAFNDHLTGEKLLFIRNAHLGLTVRDLYAWQLSRDISIDSTDINGLEAWVKFDENGRSNFANLKLPESAPGRVNFKYESVKFSLADSVVHFNDLSRKIAADANNLVLRLEPENYEVPDEEKRYKFDIASNDSTFVYDGRNLEKIDVKATGLAGRNGAEISQLRLTTPIGESTLNGALTDWAALKYDLNIESSVDLTQASTIFPLGTAIRGVGNFKGKVTGQGEQYRVAGEIGSQSLAAEGVYLKALNVAATVEGTNQNYEANGKAIAELLTFEDFRIDFPKIAGNVRGTGTDFRWVGELEAAAAKSKALTLGGLFISDAVAEYKDKQLTASAGTGRAKRFSVDDTELADLLARNLKFSRNDGVISLDAQNAQASTLKTREVELHNIRGGTARIRDTPDKTVVDLNDLHADGGDLKGTKLNGVNADSLSVTKLPNSTELNAKNLSVDALDANGARVAGLFAPEVSLTDNPAAAIVYSDKLRVAKVEAGGAILGSLNIAGVRLTIREGRIEGRSADIDAGDVELAKGRTSSGGKLESVKIAHPVFVLEPSGRYRATADMSIGGGIIGNVPLGEARASVEANNDRANLNGLTATVMNGTVNGNATVAFSDRGSSGVTADFAGLDLGKLLALRSGRVYPLEGQTTGRVDITFTGTDFSTTSGTINADITANAGNTSRGTVPVNGRVQLSATNGLFNVDLARLNTPKSDLSAAGTFDLQGSGSDLRFALGSKDAAEIDRLFRVLNISPDLEQQLDSLSVALAGGLKFDGTLTGNISDPFINGSASIETVSLRGRTIGALCSDVAVSPIGVEIKNGLLRETDGGTARFSVKIPYGGSNNTSVNAELANIDAANLIAALPLDNVLPQAIKDFSGQTSGKVNIDGLPNAAVGSLDLSSTGVAVSGQAFDSFQAKATFRDTRILVDEVQFRNANGFVRAYGSYDRASTAFDLDIEGKNVQLSSLRPLIGESGSIPVFTGTADITGKATGETSTPSSYNVKFSGTAKDVVINENAFGEVGFKGTTANQILNADLTTTLNGRPQVITASVDFGSERLPFHVETEFNQSPLAPFIALVPQLSGISISGSGTGKIEFGGELIRRNSDDTTSFTTDNLTGSARFSELALQIQDTPLVSTAPVIVQLSPREIVFESARFSGGGSNLTIAGTKALTAEGMNDLAIDGRINLGLLNAFPAIASADTFFSGFADASMRLAGVNSAARLSGTAELSNASVATFVGTDRLTFDRIKGQILFTANQVQTDRLTGYLGGGGFVASGGAAITDDLKLSGFRVSVNGTNVTVPLPEDFTTTGDAKLEITGTRGNDGNLNTFISGSILARRSLFTKEIDLANIISSRNEGSLSSGPSSIRAPRFDLTIEGRNALVIRNNLADLTASASLRLTGTTENPQVSGRITASSGTVFFRNDRYDVQRGVLDFPPNTSIEPVINLQAEAEIGGYQVFVNLSGPLTDTEQLSATVRSSPALPQADVISLITTGNLSNTQAGIPTLAQTGINTAADILTDAIISNPARKATDKLFGLNVFEIDPIISGQRLNPSARLTVGRQINNNLRVTYATNLSQDQNQVVALEYRVSNKLSVVAQYEQRSLSNVTQNRNNFSIEVRFKRRF